MSIQEIRLEKPFDTILNYADGQLWLGRRTILDILSKWDEFGNTDWVTEIDYPELTFQQTQQLLTITV